MNCAAAAAAANINLPTQPQKGAAAHPRGSVLFRCILPLIIRAEPIKPSIITVISPLFILMQFPISEVIMSIFFSHGGSFCVDKRDSALKEMCCCNRRGGGEKKKSEIGVLPFRHCSLRLRLCIRLANCLQVYIRELSMRRGFRISKAQCKSNESSHEIKEQLVCLLFLTFPLGVSSFLSSYIGLFFPPHKSSSLVAH